MAQHPVHDAREAYDVAVKAEAQAKTRLDAAKADPSTTAGRLAALERRYQKWVTNLTAATAAKEAAEADWAAYKEERAAAWPGGDPAAAADEAKRLAEASLVESIEAAKESE